MASGMFRAFSRQGRGDVKRQGTVTFVRRSKQPFVALTGRTLFLLGLLGLGGCDYWPPALQSQIETLRSDLEDAMDERQRLTGELDELRSTRAFLEREVEEKARRTAELERRVAELASRSGEAPRPVRTGPAQVGSVSPAVPAARRDGPSASPILKRSFLPLGGMQPVRRGPGVVQAQKLLRRHGFPIQVDGIYGPNTVAAVRAFQRVHGLGADGIVGPETSRALHRKAPAARLVRELRLQRPPLTGRDVFMIQRALRRAGHRVAIDGHYGPETAVAVRRFQRRHGLPPDGVVGPQTWAVISRVRQADGRYAG